MEPVAIRVLDLVVLGLYLTGMLGVGLYFARKNATTEEYFVGGRSFPGWAIGLSMLGTSISSITFLAFPAAAFQGDWRQLVANLMLPFVAVVAIIVFIPFFRRGQLTSAFEYLEDRFGPAVRVYGTISFILLQLLRLGTVLYLVAIPVGLLTGLDMRIVIIAVGVFIAFYTVFGGIDAVIWTDVAQSFVLWFGGLLCVGVILLELPGGFSEILTVAQRDNKFSLGPTAFESAEQTIWAVALLGVFNWLAMYSSDQNVVQRYVAARSMKEARKATTLYSVIAVPTWTFFFFVGTCVYVYFQAFPDTRIADLEADQVFPYFILTRVPAGFSGLVIAGVLAAAMSSLDSSINAIATISTVDILKRFVAPGRDDKFYLWAARGIATVAACLMIIGAIVFSSVEKESMNDVNWIVTSIFGGCLVGLFLTGFFTTSIGYRAALVGVAVAIGVNVFLGGAHANWWGWPAGWQIHRYWTAIAVNVVFLASAFGASWILPRERSDLRSLTVWTMDRPNAESEE